MSFKKNFRGAETFAAPTTPRYRDGYDRIFGKKTDDELFNERFKAECEKVVVANLLDQGQGDGPPPEIATVSISRIDYDRLCYIELLAMLLREDSGLTWRESDTFSQLMRAVGMQPSTPLLKFWSDQEGYVLEDIVNHLRQELANLPRGHPLRGPKEALLERVYRFERLE